MVGRRSDGERAGRAQRRAGRRREEQGPALSPSYTPSPRTARSPCPRSGSLWSASASTCSPPASRGSVPGEVLL